MNKGHGYGGIFNSETDADKAIVEQSTAEEWREAMLCEFGVHFGPMLQNPDDPPDFWTAKDGRRVAVELVQMVNQKHKQRAMNGESPYHGTLFTDMQWTRERLVETLAGILKAKGDKYTNRGICIDALVVHTDEPWLNSQTARSWLSTDSVLPHPNISSAYLLFFYEPGSNTDSWPLLQLYGDPS